jgi:hypothetical protein
MTIETRHVKSSAEIIRTCALEAQVSSCDKKFQSSIIESGVQNVLGLQNIYL